MEVIKHCLMTISIVILLQSNATLAEQPHLEATPDCPNGEVCCPTKIFCSFKEGCGDVEQWMIDGGGINTFKDVQQFNLSKITANRLWFIQSKNKGYMFSCIYDSEFGTIGLSSQDGYKLNGNWEYSSFMNNQAECSSSDQVACTGTKMY